MKVEDILRSKGHTVETVPPEASAMLVLHKLSSLGIGALVVSPDGRRVDGVISERDIVRGLVRHGERLLQMDAAALMVEGGPVCSPSSSITAVMVQMTRTRNRHLPVVQDGALCGLVSIGDVVKHRLEEMELETSVLRDAYLAGH